MAQHTVMPKKLAHALMEAGMQHFDSGGIGGVISNIAGSNNNYTAVDPNLDQQNFIARIGWNQQQQDEIYRQQQSLANQLLAQSQGQGPNPAQAQLAQNTGNNVATQQALMASQRGAAVNPALIARAAARQGAQTQQQGAGQAATLGAQQQLASQGQLQNLYSQQANQGLQGEQINQSGQAAQNAAVTTGSLGASGIDAQISAQNTNTNKGIFGGLVSGISQAFGLAKGGEVPKMADGGISNFQTPAMQNPNILAFTDNTPVFEFGKKKKPAVDDAKLLPAVGGASELGGAEGLGSLAVMAASQGGKIPFSQALLNGGKVPGKAEVKGDSPKNDTQPTLLSPQEIVLPRSVTLAKDAPERAKEFVAHLLAKKKGPGSYGDVIAARKLSRGGCV